MENVGNLTAVVQEVESHISAAGWDQPIRLFAIVSTADLIASEPALAAELNLSDSMNLTSIEQELSANINLEELLATIAWPQNVLGTILAIERIVLPPDAQAQLPSEDEPNWLAKVSNHPLRRDVRIISAVMRNGENLNALRYREHDEPSAVAIAPDLVVNLNESLLATFSD